MLDAKEDHWCSQKSAQMGVSEVLINLTLYLIDQKGLSVLYGLPSERPDARDFCLTRFDPAVKLSPYLQQLFAGGPSSTALKMAGTRALYIRGSRGGASFESIPCGAIFLDEVDKMTDTAVKLARERASGQVRLIMREASTPSLPGVGVNQTFDKSTQDFFTFPCPHCSRWTRLVFPDCLVITAEDSKDPNLRNSYIKCKECNHKLDHKEKPVFLGAGKWEPTFQNRNIRGFHISQLYSCTLQPYRLAESYLDSSSNLAEEQIFYNSKLGEAHVAEGAAVTDEHINACLRPYSNQTMPTSPVVTMGIDVGKFLHFKIMEYKFQPNARDVNLDSHARLLYYGKIKTTNPGFTELNPIISKYNPALICIDAAPERISSEKFVKQFPGRGFTVNYSDSTDGKTLNETDLHKLTVNRTYWIDQYLGRYMNSTIEIPNSADQELRVHLKSMQKMYEKDRFGEVIGRYVKGSDRTDYAHCGVYCEIALRKAFEGGYVTNLKVNT